MKWRRYASTLFVRWGKCWNEVNFIDLESFYDRLSCGEMSVMDGIERPAQYRNPHVPAPILAWGFQRRADFFRALRGRGERCVNHSGS